MQIPHMYTFAQRISYQVNLMTVALKMNYNEMFHKTVYFSTLSKVSSDSNCKNSYVMSG